MTSIVILNGSPNSGKDSVAQYLKSTFGYSHLEFKNKLFELTKAIFCISDKEWEYIYTRQYKEVPHIGLGGLSPRQALIKVSEEVIKPNFGKDYFGIAAAKSVKLNQVNVFSDGGFKSELEPLINKFGAENILILQIHRPGCSFAGDSRSYIDHPDIATVKIDNDKSEESFWYKVSNEITNWLAEKYHAHRD